MSDIQNRLLHEISDVKDHIAEIKVTMARNTESLEHHVKRTDTLQDMVEPVFRDFIERKAVEDYKKKVESEKKDSRDKVLYSLKLPGAILAAITATATLLAWLGRK